MSQITVWNKPWVCIITMYHTFIIHMTLQYIEYGGLRETWGGYIVSKVSWVCFYGCQWGWIRWFNLEAQWGWTLRIIEGGFHLVYWKEDIPKEVSRLNVPLCWMVYMPLICSILVHDIKKLEVEITYKYWPRASLFYVSIYNEHCEVRSVKTEDTSS